MFVSDPPLEGEVFAKVPLAGCTDVADVSESAHEKLPRWGVYAGKVQLFLVATPVGDDEPSADAIKDALSRERLQSSWSLERARIGPGSWLLARVPPPPAAAPGASRRRRVGDPRVPSLTPPVLPLPSTLLSPPRNLQLRLAASRPGTCQPTS
jgi:hypothetical protein